MKHLFSCIKSYRKEAVLAPLFKLLEASLELVVPLIVAEIVDRGIASGDKGYIIGMCLVLVAFGLVGLGFSLTAQYFAARAAVGTSAALRKELFGKLQSLSFSQIDGLGTSTMITRMTSDVNQVQTGINMVLRLFLRSPFIVFGAMIMAFVVDACAGLVFVAVIPLLAVVVYAVMGLCIPLYKKVQGGMDKVFLSTRENLAGVRVIRAFCKEEEEVRQFDERNASLRKSQKKAGVISALTNPFTFVLVNLAAIALIYVGAIRVDGGYLEQGDVFALYGYLSQILVELIKLANLIVTVTKAVSCEKRIEAVLDMQGEKDVEAPDSAKSESGNTDLTEGVKSGASKPPLNKTVSLGEAAENTPTIFESGHPSEDSGGASNKNSNGNPGREILRFDHVTFAYKGGGAPALTDVDFTVCEGETVGVIGGTGSGKSTLVHLIPRFYRTTEGGVYYRGQNVDTLSAEALRERVGIVLQKAVLFQGTIRSNLEWGKAGATDEELMRAVSLAQATDVIEAKGGLDAEIAQEGKNLSGGQRQRLTIARALVRDPDILILDDSASALDYATDARLRSAIGKMGCTVFIVSQRTSSIRHADKIVVLDDGKIVGIGTHEELVKTCEVYCEINRSQYGEENA